MVFGVCVFFSLMSKMDDSGPYDILMYLVVNLWMTNKSYIMRIGTMPVFIRLSRPYGQVSFLKVTKEKFIV